MSKRGENIYKRKDGRWEGRYIKKRDINGKAIYGYIYSKSYTEAKTKLANAKVCLQRHPENDIFEHYALEWLETKKFCVKASTFSKYHSILFKHILPFWGKTKIADFSPQGLRMFVEQKLKKDNSNCDDVGLAPKTTKDILTIILSILSFAHCEINFSYSFEKAHEKTDDEILSRAEQIKLTSKLLQNPDNTRLGVLISLYTGIRIGELCALRYSDISLTDGLLYIKRTMQRISEFQEPSEHKTKVITTIPKTQKAIRSIPIPDFLRNEIEKSFSDDGEAYFLTGKADSFMEPRTLQYKFERILKETGVKKINFHALRHTFATRCIESGFEIKSLSEILGHASVNITLNRYAHSSIELKKNNMTKMVCTLMHTPSNF